MSSLYRLCSPLFSHPDPFPACGADSDVLGNHAIHCASSGERIARHNGLRDCVFHQARYAQLAPRKEVRDLIPSRGDKPADMHAGMVKTDPSLGPSLWLCIECSYTSKNNSNVYEHIEARHVGSSGYFCSICDKTCPTRNAFRIHNIRYHPNEHWGVYLSHMPKYCPTASSLRNHNDRYHKGSKLPF